MISKAVSTVEPSSLRAIHASFAAKGVPFTEGAPIGISTAEATLIAIGENRNSHKGNCNTSQSK